MLRETARTLRNKVFARLEKRMGIMSENCVDASGFGMDVDRQGPIRLKGEDR
jgi:hypothetical protein